MEERSTFQFFRSFYDAARKIPDKEMQADFLMAICEYALNGNPPEETGIIGALFELVKPNLDTSRKRAQAGRVGGEAKRSNVEANAKQNEAKPSKAQNPVSDGRHPPRRCRPPLPDLKSPMIPSGTHTTKSARRFLAVRLSTKVGKKRFGPGSTLGIRWMIFGSCSIRPKTAVSSGGGMTATGRQRSIGW